MPTFSYSCSCGLRFQSVLPVSKKDNPQKCDACGSMVQKDFPTGLSSEFSVSSSGVGPQNTGVHGFDTNYDRVIGKSAKEGWEKVDRRNEDKRRTLSNNPGKGNFDLSRNPDGSYRVMSKQEKEIHARTHIIANEANKFMMGQSKK